MTDDTRGGLLDAFEKLAQLARVDSDLAQLVDLRFFHGLTLRECAEILDISEEQAARNWRTAKCWLEKELR